MSNFPIQQKLADQHFVLGSPFNTNLLLTCQPKTSFTIVRLKKELLAKDLMPTTYDRQSYTRIKNTLNGLVKRDILQIVSEENTHKCNRNYSFNRANPDAVLLANLAAHNLLTLTEAKTSPKVFWSRMGGRRTDERLKTYKGQLLGGFYGLHRDDIEKLAIDDSPLNPLKGLTIAQWSEITGIAKPQRHIYHLCDAGLIETIKKIGRSPLRATTTKGRQLFEDVFVPALRMVSNPDLGITYPKNISPTYKLELMREFIQYEEAS